MPGQSPVSRRRVFTVISGVVALAAVMLSAAFLATDVGPRGQRSAPLYVYDGGLAKAVVETDTTADVGSDLWLRAARSTEHGLDHHYDDVSQLARVSARLGRYALAPRATSSALDDVVGAACSFSAVTAVVMADGSRKAISDVEVGDYVLAEDPETGERGPRRVTHVWEHDDTLVDLEVDGDLVTTTEDHPFWNATDGEWQEAQELDAGDRVRTADGELVTVGGIVLRTERRATAFNLTVDGIHTYFVGVGEDDVLVHNTCNWGNASTLDDHFQRHGADFGAPSADTYGRLADDFFQSRGQHLTRIDPNTGAIRVYDPASNTFGSYNAGGTTRTFYKPDPAVHGYPTNWDYWMAQPG